MTAAALALGLGAVAYFSTNLDDLVILIGFFADPAYAARHVVIGQFLGISCLVAASLVLSLTSMLIPPAYLGFLGLLPFGIGLTRLLDRAGIGAAAVPGAPPDPDHGMPAWRSTRMLGVAAVTIANGGDNIGTYTPLFAHLPAAEAGLVTALFMALTALWCTLGWGLVRHRRLGTTICRYGARALPWLLMGLGLWMMVRGHRVAPPW